jgi:hypothetical protein
MHRYFSQTGGPKHGTPEREDWEASKADVHRYMHTNQYTKQAADPKHDQHFPGHEQWKIDNPNVEKYTEEGTEGMWEGAGQVISGAANIAFDPLVIAGGVGYYAGKKGLLDKVGRGRKGPPPRNDRPLPPDDPFRS